MSDVTGETPVGPQLAPKGRRFAAGVIDLVIIPVLIGLVIGIFLINASEVVRSVILIVINIAWLIFRDAVYSPGRKMVGTKLISLKGDKVTVPQAFLRNLFLVFPFMLVTGYCCESVRAFFTENLNARRIGYGIVLILTLFIGFSGFGSFAGDGVVFAVIMVFIIMIPCIVFLFFDRDESSAGVRLLDVKGKMRVVLEP